MINVSTFLKSNFFATVFLTTLIGTISIQNSQAAVITSKPTGGNWGTTGTWDLGRLPANNDDVVIAAGSTVIGNTTVSFASYGSLTVNGTLNMGAFNMSMLGDLVINTGGNLTCTGTGTKIFNNITNYGTYTNATFTGLITCKINFDNENIFTINAGGLTLNGANGGTSFYNGAGTFTQTTGTVTISAASANFSFTNNATYTITGTGGITFSGASSSYSFTNNGTFTVGSGTITLGGAGSSQSFNNGGTFNAGTGTVTFTATNNTHYITGNDPLFYNLTVNGTGAVVDAVSYIGTMTVTNTLTITLGILNGTTALYTKTFTIANSANAIFQAGGQTFVSGTLTTSLVASLVPQTGSFIFNGGAAQSIAVKTGTNFYDVEIANTVSTGLTLTAATTYVIQDNLTIDAGAILTSGTTAIVDIGYQWINNGGTFTPSTGTVAFNNGGYYNYISGSATTATFNNLTAIDAYYLDATALTTLNVNGNFIMTSGGLNPPATMTVAGTVTLTAGTFYSPTTILNVGSTWTNNGGTFDYWDCSCDGVVNFNGAAAQSLTGTATSQNFQSITVNKAGAGAAGTLTIANAVAVTVNGELTLTKGALATGTNTATFNGQVYQTTGTFASTGTVVYQNYEMQNVAAGTYKTLTFDGYDKVLLPGTITISGVFTTGGSSGGSAAGNTVVLSGAANTQTIPVFNFDGSVTGTGYNNLTVTNAQLTGGNISFGGNVAVGGVFSYSTNAVTIPLGNNSLVIGPAGSLTTGAGFSATHMVVLSGTGKLVKGYNTGAQAYTYPVGVGANYEPVTLTFHNVTTAGDVSLAITSGVDPNAIAPPTPSTNWLKKYWSISDPGTGITFDYYSATVKFLAADYNTSLTAGAGGESTMGSQVYVSNLYPSGGWISSSPVTTRTALNPTVSGVTYLGDLTFATCTSLTNAGNPTDQGFCSTASTGSVSYSVSTTGTPGTFQWYENGVSLGTDHSIYSGAQTSTLTLTFSSNPSALNGNTYYCVATGTCGGGFTTTSAHLYVGNDAPPAFTISVSPSENLVWDQGIAYGAGRWTDEQCYGSPYTFTCNTTYSGTLPLTYTWIDFECFCEFTSSSNQWVLNTGTDKRLDGTSYAGPQWWGNGTDDILVNATNACGINGFDADIIIMVDSARTPPTLLAKTPNVASVCAGTSVSATFNPGSGGDCTDGMPYNAATNEPKLVDCTDEYEYIIDGGTPVTYTPGNPISTATATSSVVIKGARGGSSSGCSGTAFTTLASWVVTPGLGTPTPITVSAGAEPTCQLSNGTTTTTYSTTAANNTGFNWSLSNNAAGSITSGGVMTWANGFSGTVNIQVTANGCAGPSSQVTRTVNITPAVGTPTTITISAGTEPNCQLTNGTTTTTYATTAANNTGFNWSLSDNSAGSITSGGVMTWANGYSGSVNIQVTASGCNGLSSQKTRTVNVFASPVAVISGSPFTGCVNPGVALGTTGSGAGSGAITSYQWANSGGNIGSATGSTYTATATDNYSVAITNSNSCSTTSSAVSVTTNANPSLAVSGGDVTVCADALPAAISASSAGNTIDWYDASSAGTLLQSGSNTYAAPAAGTFYAESRNTTTGCVSTSRIPVALTVNASPTQYILNSSTGGLCVPADVNLSGSDPGIDYHLWYNGSALAVPPNPSTDDQTGTGIQLDFGLQNNPGSYTVVATNNSTHCVATMIGSIDPAICTATWVGTSTNFQTNSGLVPGDWSDPDNWDHHAIPDVCGVTVIINVGHGNGVYQPVISATSAISPIQIGDVQIADGDSIVLDRQDLNVCGNWTGGANNAMIVGGGTVHLNGSINSTLNSGPQTISANTQFPTLQIEYSNGVTVLDGATVTIQTGLHMKAGNLDVSAGKLHLMSTSSSNNSYIDDFTATFTGKVIGNNVYADRYVAVSGSNQHYVSSPVNTPPFSQLGSKGPDGVYVLPTQDCDETKSDYDSYYGTVFQYNDGHQGPNKCMLGNWQIKNAGNTENGRGYSVYLNGWATTTLNGSANTGDISVGNLNSSGYPYVRTKQGTPIQSGWNLVGNPYPSAINLSIDRTGDGFDNEILLWQTSGPFSGSWQPALINPGVGLFTIDDKPIAIAPFQAFTVRVDSLNPPGLYTFKFHESERVRNTNVTFYRTQTQNKLVLNLNYNGMSDMTAIAFNPSATYGFDGQYDANKSDGSAGRPTLYTYISGAEWYALNTVPSLTQTATVPMGLRPENTGTMTLTPSGIESFDPTTYIYLEDKQTGTMANLRNGAYTFNTRTTDNQERFVLHFTPPATILISDASCDMNGMISIEQPGNANWNYTLTDNNNVMVSNGVLNSGDPVSLSVNVGVYTLTLKDNTGYTVIKTVQVGGAQPVAAAFGASATNTQVLDNIIFVSNTSNASSYSWDFGDGISATGKSTSHSYTAEGAYVTTLTVTGLSGCVSTTTQTITVTSKSVTGINNVTNDKLSIWSYENGVYVDFSKISKVDAEIELYNVLGQLLSDEKFGSSTIYNKQLVNTEAAYVIIKVINDDRITTKKLFISNGNK